MLVIALSHGPVMADALRITTGPADDNDATSSPDGRLIAFNSKRSGNYDVWVVPRIPPSPSGRSDDAPPGSP